MLTPLTPEEEQAAIELAKRHVRLSGLTLQNKDSQLLARALLSIKWKLESLTRDEARRQLDAGHGLVDALADCLDVIEPIRDEMYKQGTTEHDPVRLDAGKCCDEVLAFARAALKTYEEAKSK